MDRITRFIRVESGPSAMDDALSAALLTLLLLRAAPLINRTLSGGLRQLAAAYFIT